jgi:hypothetical protein
MKGKMCEQASAARPSKARKVSAPIRLRGKQICPVVSTTLICISSSPSKAEEEEEEGKLKQNSRTQHDGNFAIRR